MGSSPELMRKFLVSLLLLLAVSYTVAQPTVTPGNITVTSGTGVYVPGEVITVEWDNSLTGDANTIPPVSIVTINFFEVGGSAVEPASVIAGIWTASHVVTSGSIDATDLRVSVNAFDGVGTTTVQDDTDISMDNQPPTVSADEILLVSIGSGPGGEFIAGDDITFRWDNTAGTGDNNSDITGVTMNFSAFGGGSAVVATNSSGLWEATFALPNGTLDASNLNVSVTATDDAGNETTTVGTNNLTVDNEVPTFVNAHFFDTDGNGSIDEIVIEMSEEVDENSAEVADFTFTGGPASGIELSMPASNALDISDNDQYVTLSVSVSGTGTSNVAYNPAGGVVSVLTDAVGNAAAPDGTVDPIDQASPVLTAQSPGDDDTDVAVNSNITLTFSENVQAGSGDISIIDISGTDDRVITLPNGQISFATNTVTINPSSDLEFFTEYAINVGSSAVSDGTNTFDGIAGSSAFSFTTEGDVPTYDATWLDNNSDGTIDRLRLSFSIPVVVTDADGGVGGFDAILLGGGLTIASSNYSGTVSQLDLIVTGVSSGTADPSVSIQYSTGGASSIVASAGGEEVPNTETPGTTTDGAVPVVLNVTSSDTDGPYILGDPISIDVEFSESVTALGVPQLTLETGGTDAVVDLTSGSGSSTLTFDYTVGPGEVSGDLNYQSTTALSEGTSIRDAAANDADRTLPPLAGPGSLATNKNFLVDGDVPTVVSVTSPQANFSYRPGQSITIQVIFNDVVNVSGTPTITLETGSSDAVVNLTSGTGTNTLSGTYTVSVGQETPDLDYVAGSLTAGAGIQDVNGNNADLTLADPGNPGSLGANKNITIDGVLPTFINAHFFDTDLDGNIDEVVIEMSEPINPFTAEAADFTMTGGAISAIELAGPADNPLDVDDNDEYVTLTASLTGTGTANIDYNKTGGATDQLQDLIGNEADNDATINEVDAAGPVIIDALTADNDFNGQIDRITLTFSENIDDGNSGPFSNTTLDVDGYSGEGKVSGDDDNAEVIISFTESGNPDTDNTPSITLLSGQVEDAASASIVSPQVFNATEDGAAPAIVAATTIDDDLNGQIDRLHVEMSEPIDDGTSDLDGGTVDLESPYNNNSPDAETGTTADDEFILVTFNEESTPDTDATPEITLNSGQLRDQSPASNVLGSNVTFSATVDGAVPILLLDNSSVEPNVDAQNISTAAADTITFTYSEPISSVATNNLYIYNTTDLINAVVSSEATDPVVSISGDRVTWGHGTLLDKGESYVVAIEEGAFTDGNGLNSPELLDVGDGRWKWDMVADGNPNYVYSPQDGATNIPPFARIYFYFDEPVRIQNSVDRDLEVDIIDDYNDSNSGTDQFVENVDNYFNPPGNGTSDEIDNSPNHIPPFIFPIHQVPCGGPPYNCDPVENYTKEKIFDISEIIGYNSDNGYIPGEWYELKFNGGCFEDLVDDNGNAEFKIKFQIDGSDAVRPTTTTFVPNDNAINVDVDATTSLVINFDESVATGFGNIQLFANLNPDVLALEIPATSPLVTVLGSQVTIDISGITLAGNVEYYVNFDKGSFVDLVGNTNVGLGNETTWNFTTESEQNAPEIITLSPADNTTGVDIDQDLAIVFDEPVQEGTGGNLDVRLSSNGFIVETIPSSSFTFDGNSVTIPISQLGGLSGYYINIDNTAIADLGNTAFPGISGSFAWSFTTTSEAIAPSAITSTFSPAHLSSGASVSDDISFFFDEVVSPRAGNLVEIRESGGALVESFDVTDSEILVSGNQVVINPTADLAFVTDYYVTVAAGAFEDASGNLSNAVGGDGNWNFTTGADASNPFVLTLSPNDNSTGIALSPTLTIGFSESVQDQGAGVVNLLYSDGTVAHILDLADFDFSDDLNPSISLAGEGIVLSGNTEYFVEIPGTSFEDLSSLPFAGIAGNGNWSFTTTTDITQPIPTGSPTGTGVAVTTDFVITFPEPVTANTGAIRLLYTDLTEVEVFDVSAADPSNGNTTYTIETSNNLSGGVQYYVNIDAGAFVDNTGNPSTGVIGSIDWSFTTSDDGVAPEIVSLTPANDATSISTASASLVLTFDEPVDLGSGNIQLLYDDGVVIETFTTGNVTLSNGNAVATVAPYAVLDGQTEYYVSVDNGFFEDNDSSPNDFAGITGDGSWSFFTGNDLIDPTPSGGVTPADGSSGNQVDPTITITMNERVEAGSGIITIATAGQTVSINVLDGTQITGFGTNTITINPSESLINGENYTITVPAGAFEDPTGNTNAPISWSFAVGNATIVTPSNSIICTNQDFVPLNNLVIEETMNDDFLVGTDQTLIITLPAQFEFNTALTPVVNITGDDLTAGSAVVGFNTLTITFTTDGQSGATDEITVSNLEAQYLGSATGIFNALRTGGTGNMKGNNVVHGQPHIVLDVNDPPDPPTLNPTFWQVDGSEDILVPISVTRSSVTATSPGGHPISVYNDIFDAGSSESGPSPFSLDYELLPDQSNGGFSMSATPDADRAVYTYYFTADDGTCESDGFKRNILVLDYDQTPGGLSFVGDVNEVLFVVSEPTNHEVSYTGPALTNETHSGGQSSITFSPNAAGAGSFLVEIITTNNFTGETVILPRDITVAATADIFGMQDLDIDYCESDGELTFDARLDDLDADDVFYGFTFDGVPITPAPAGWDPNSLTNPTSGWQIDLDTIAPGSHVIERLVVINTSVNPAVDNEQFLSADLNVYTNPTVEIDNLPGFFCEDDIAFDLTATVTNTNFETSVLENNIVNVTSYFIQKLTGVGAGASETIEDGGAPVQFDPTNPLGDGTAPVGRYEITYTSINSDDPNFPTPANSKGCINTETRIIEVFATPDLPDIVTDLTGIGSESIAGDRINLQFCVGDVVPDIEAMVAADESITWYRNNSLTTTYTGVGTQNNILESEELFGTDRPNSAFDITIFATKSSYLDDVGPGFTGCESPPIVINIRVYEDPTIPVIDISADAASQVNLTSYLFEYCDDYGTGNVTFTSLLPDSEAYYNLYDSTMTWQAAWAFNTLEFTDIGFMGAPGTDTTIFVSRVLNDSTFVPSGNGEFAGCESGLIELTINVYEIPTTPPPNLFSNDRTDYYICSGDFLGTITSPAEANTRYAWYEDADDDGLPDNRLEIDAFDDRFAVQDASKNEFGFSNENFTTDAITYNYWVTQFRDFNDATGFVGCESSTTQLTITVFPDPGSPEFNAPSSTSINRDDINIQFLEASYCEGRITGTEDFLLSGNTDAVFNWYRANPADSSIAGNAVHTHMASAPVTSSELKISDAEQDTLYFVVSQVNNIVTETDETVFDGCETEKEELAFVTLYVYDIPSRPQTTTGSFEYCEDAVFANGIELTGEGGVTYRWYRDDDDDGSPDAMHFFEGQVAQADDLALQGDNGTGGYQFWVTQTQNIGDGVNTFEGCASEFQPITVFEVPPAVSTIEFEPAYCVDILGNNTVIIDYQGVPNAVFTWYDESLNVLQSSPGLFFDTDENTIGTYTYFISQTFNNCESELTEVTFTIFPVPETPTFTDAPNLSLDGSGDYEFIYCRDEDISDEILSISNSQTGFIYEWYFDELLTEPLNIQGADPDADEIAFVNLGIGGNTAAAGSFDRFVRSRVGTCFSNVREFDITIGEAPVVAFTWEGLTKAPEGSTEFAFYNENPAVQNDEIQEIRFSIDGSVVNADVGPTGADLSNYTHDFMIAREYQVELFMRTSEVCRDSVERVVEILDVVTVPAEGYLQTFENVDHGWFDEKRQDDGRSDGRTSSWEVGIPAGAIINSAFSEQNAWVTDLDFQYGNSEFSWVYSPAFDISALEIPVVSFFHQHYFPNNRDGVVFQFSDNNGETWNTLGRLDQISSDLSEPSGRNWYDGGDIPTVPGDLKINDPGSQEYNRGGFGWTAAQEGVGWLETIHILENFDRSSLIRFRFALSSSPGDEDEGFAFDDFRLYNSDKITLLESFLNVSETGAKAAFDDLAETVDERAEGSVAWITYFTDLDISGAAARDEINRANTIDPSARVGYYGINEVPSSAIEGEVRKINISNSEDPDLSVRGFTRASLTIAGLESKKFDIQLTQNSSPDDILSVTGTFRAEEAFEDAELSIRFIVIEKEITGLEVGEFTADDTLRNVLRKILPSAAGIVKIGDVSDGQVFTETVEWKLSNVYDPSELDVIAFIQNENAVSGKREVLQTAILNGDFSDKQLILSVLDQLRNGDPFVIYPNPVDDEFKLEILNPVKEAMDWTIFDQTGREVMKGQVPGGETRVNISTNRLPSGMFLLQLIHNDVLFEPKRIIVVHE